MKKILLALDIFGEDQNLVERISRALSILVEGRNVTVEPVFVSSPKYRTFIQNTLLPGEAKFPTARTQAWLDRFHLPGYPRLTVLWEGRDRLHFSVERLLQYASETSTDLIALTAKATLEATNRPRVGSFAKRLLLDAKLPQFVVGCKARIPDQFRHILFPTDFTHEPTFEKILTLSRELHAEVTLYHKVKSFPAYFTTDMDGSGDPDCFEQSETVLRARGEQWKEIARAKQCELDFIIDNTGGDVAEGISAKADAVGADLIALAALSGHLSSALFGNVTRDVVREAECPVWVIHPAAAVQSNKNERRIAS